jgi:hypothetical protein
MEASTDSDVTVELDRFCCRCGRYDLRVVGGPAPAAGKTASDGRWLCEACGSDECRELRAEP